jgi:hypothetical protein
MSTLFERIAGRKADGTDPEEGKLPIHIFTSLLSEFKDGRVTGAEAKAYMGLTNEQVSEVQWIIQAARASGNPMQFLRVIKDHFYLAEWRGTAETFSDEQGFYAKLEQVLIDEGATPPPR